MPDPPTPPLPRSLLVRCLPAAVALVSGAVIFWVLSTGSDFIAIDSGPYLSIAHNLVTEGSLHSNFNYLGNFDHIPGPTNIVVPGFSILIGLCSAVTANHIQAACAVLFISLCLIQFFTIKLVANQTGDMAYGIGASFILVCQPILWSWACIIHTELSFIACILGGMLAGIAILEGRAGPWTRWLIFPFLSAMVCLIRYLGIFFPLTFSVIYLVMVWRKAAIDKTRSWPSILGYLAAYNVLSFLPLGLWLMAARNNAPTALAPRPPSEMPALDLVLDSVVYLGSWLWVWGIVGVCLWLWLRRSMPTVVPASKPRIRIAEAYIALNFVGYVGLLIIVRSTYALYPLDEIGYRYIAPGWPIAFCGGALLFHRYVWSRQAPTIVRALLAAGVAGIICINMNRMLHNRLPPPFPIRTATFAQAVAKIQQEDVILCNYGQLFCISHPDATVISIPSQQDYSYRMDLEKLVTDQGVKWIVLFDRPEKDIIYPPWFSQWLAAPPTGVVVANTWHYGDGVIYELEPAAATQ